MATETAWRWEIILHNREVETTATPLPKYATNYTGTWYWPILPPRKTALVGMSTASTTSPARAAGPTMCHR